jgi:hypothetical protein
MKELFATIAIVLACSLSACGESTSDQGQVVISSVSGGLEAGRIGAVTIELENNISFMPPPSGILMAKGSCLDVVATLQSNESKISVISAPEYAGSLAPGENQSLEFMASADQDIDLGIHPMGLVIRYSRLSGVKSTGSIPDVLFGYESAEEILPLDIKVSLGPRAHLEVDDATSPGKASELTFTFKNTGDEPMRDLHAQPSPQYPFRPLSGIADLGTLEPGGSVSVGVRVFTENDTKTGFYALPCKIGYQSDTLQRSEEVAAIVEVRERSWNGAAITASAAVLLVAAAIYAILRVRGRKRAKRRSL